MMLLVLLSITTEANSKVQTKETIDLFLTWYRLYGVYKAEKEMDETAVGYVSSTVFIHAGTEADTGENDIIITNRLFFPFITTY